MNALIHKSKTINLTKSVSRNTDEEETAPRNASVQKSCSCMPQRYLMCVNIFIGMMICYMARTCISLAMSEMTFKINKNVTSTGGYCPLPGNKTTPENSKNAEFHWNAVLQHQILFSFYIGYFLAHIPGGIIADLFGGKHVYGGGAIFSAVMSLLAPVSARLSPYVLLLCRVLQGFAQGVMFPSMSSLVAKWAPVNERATMIGFCNSGVMIGMALGNILSGLILQHIPGWEPVFYIYGAVGIVWWVFWCFFTYSTPDEHPFVSETEKTMIKEQLNPKKRPKYIPFLKILTSKPYLVLVLINLGHAWSMFTMVTELPLYLSNVLHFKIQTSGAISALPYLGQWVSSIGTGILSDWIARQNWISQTSNRKIFSVLSNVLPAPFLLGASFAGCNYVLASAMFVVMMFFKGMSSSSVRANIIDLSPNFAGILMAIMNGIGSLAGIFGPLIVGLIITGEGSIYEWRTVFCICVVVLIAFSIPYLFFGSAEAQPWDSVQEEETTGVKSRTSISSKLSVQKT